MKGNPSTHHAYVGCFMLSGTLSSPVTQHNTTRLTNPRRWDVKNYF